MADISEAELQEQKDAIQLFNDANNGKVNIHDLRKLLRSFGEKIDTSAIESYVKYFVDTNDERVNLDICPIIFSIFAPDTGMDPSEQELSKMISELDAEGSETLEFPEFVSMMAKRMKNKDSEQELREAFSVLDERRTGFVKSSELRQLLVEVMGESEEEVRGMLKEVAANKAGDINIEDFIRIVLK